jgi:L-glutamine synthetase (EC 6.3.1.2)
MDYTRNEVLQFVSENDVKFIRMAFCDIFGTQKTFLSYPRSSPGHLKVGFHLMRLP